VTSRVVPLDEAIAAIPDGATVASDGFTMMGVAEAVLSGIERSFLESGHPRDLIAVHAAGQSNVVGGFEHFAQPGLVRRVVGPHWGLMPRMSQFLATDQAEAICLPQGQLSTLLRSIAAGRPGNLSRIGLGTFVDPRLGGGKVNPSASRDAPDYVPLLDLGGEEILLYRSFPIDVGIIRATSVDSGGNCSQEEEAVTCDALAIAQAAHNSGGVVICQAKRLVPGGTIPPRQVAVPGCLVDYVVVTDDPDTYHRQTDTASFDDRFILPPSAISAELPGLPGGDRAAIGRRAIGFLEPGDIVNIGTGIPGDTIGPALKEAGLIDSVTLTVESGVYGGVPQGGTDFGIAAGPSAIMPHPTQFDFYNGRGLDITFMGAGEVDRNGNVNVSRLGPRVIGCGGFIDIVQSARRVCFCFTMGGRHRKFVPEVTELTFSAAQSRTQDQQVVYVTERAVFELADDGLVLTEVADGADVRHDVLDLIPFPVRVAADLRRITDSSTPAVPGSKPTIMEVS
jgi:propionate CoA-transferase